MPSENGVASAVDAAALPRRLHPFTLLFATLGIGRVFILPALLGTASVAGGDLGRIVTWILPILAGPALATAIGKYLTFRFFLTDDELIIESGVLLRRRRVIPLARVQTIEVRQTTLQRLCGVAQLRVETAGGDRTEATLEVLGVRDAEAFRAALTARRHAVDTTAEAPAAGTVLARLSPGTLALAGATANEIGFFLALLAGAYQLLDELPARLPLPGTVDPATLAARIEALDPLLFALAAAALLLGLGWIFSIAGAVIGYHGFTLERAAGELHARYGALARREATAPLQRIQALRIEESFLRRPLRLAALRIETAGAAPGQHQPGNAELFLPLARADDLPRLAAAVLPGFDLQAVEFRPVHPRARRRVFFRYSALLGAAAAALAVAVHPLGLALLALLPGAYLLARLEYRARGYALLPGYVAARAGLINRVTWIIPRTRIQTLHLRESPLQRRHGLATLVVDTAAGGRRGVAEIVDLGKDEAASLLTELAERVGRP
jgi:putative membrane protein